jgi:hypothetical protein
LAAEVIDPFYGMGDLSYGFRAFQTHFPRVSR